MIRALSIGLQYDASKNLEPIYEDWLKVEEDVNAGSSNSLKSKMTGGEWFVFMRSEKEFVSTAYTGMIVSLIFAFIVLNLSTLNFIIAIYSIFCIGIIIVSVVAIMEIAGWEFGVAEAIAVVILIGFSVDYVVHLANHYVECPFKKKFARMQHALKEIGISIFSGAITTIFAGLALFLCTITMFTKFAILICSTILFSLFMSFCLFSSICHTIGPEGTCGDLRYWVVRPINNLLKKLWDKIKKKPQEVNVEDKYDETQGQLDGPIPVSEK